MFALVWAYRNSACGLSPEIFWVTVSTVRTDTAGLSDPIPRFGGNGLRPTYLRLEDPWPPTTARKR